MKYKVWENGSFEHCAKAASMSYGKDLSVMTTGERIGYVERIWDKHTNVSEHFARFIEFTEIPRWATFLLAFQRDGFSMTEFSQRRRKPETDDPAYEALIENGEKLEDARKVLHLSTPSECVVSMNREVARNIARSWKRWGETFPCVRDLDMPHILADTFAFHLDDRDPGSKFTPVSIVDGLDADVGVTHKSGIDVSLTLPMYSMHQLIRHRDLRVHDIFIHARCALEDVTNMTLASARVSCLYWGDLIKTRSLADTQEPLRSIVKSLDL